MIKYNVLKPDGSVNEVLLLKVKNTNKYRYVNLTKGHICVCEFDSIELAEQDIEDRLTKGLLLSYIKTNQL